MLKVEAWLHGPAESVLGISVKHSDLLLGFGFVYCFSGVFNPFLPVLRSLIPQSYRISRPGSCSVYSTG